MCGSEKDAAEERSDRHVVVEGMGGSGNLKPREID